jgi:hypothetical protein
MKSFFKETILTLFISALFFFLPFYQTMAQINYQWAKSMGGTGADYASYMVTDHAGNVYVTGYFNGTVDFDPSPDTAALTSAGQADIFIAKYDALGNYIWAKRIGNIENDEARSIAPDGSGDILITGYFEGPVDFDAGPGISNLISNGGPDIFIAKYDTAGNYVWAKGIGGTNTDIGTAVTTEVNDNVLVTGWSSNVVDFDPGPGVFYLYSGGDFVLKLNSSGDFVWVRGSNLCYTRGWSIKCDKDGNVYAAGDIYPCPLMNSETSEDSIGKYLPPYSYPTMYILKLNATGNFLWMDTIFANSSYLTGPSLALDSCNNVYLTGFFMGTYYFDPANNLQYLSSNGGYDIFIAKYDSTGNYSWANKIGGSSDDRGSTIALDTLGNIYIAGYFTDTVDFDPSTATHNLSAFGGSDIFIAKYDNAGNYYWAKDLGGTASESANSIVVNSQTDIYITGHYYGTAGFDPPNINGQLTSLGGSDIFIAKYYSCNVVDSSSQTFTICDGHGIVVGGNTYSSGGTYYEYFATGHPCDSLSIVHINAIPAVLTNQYFTLCTGETVLVGTHILDTTGIFIDTLTSITGCDSIITTTLNYVGPNVINTYIDGATITALTVAAGFQWLDCNNGFAPIPGATGQVYTATTNGSYAVVAYLPMCNDTSACVDITCVGENDLSINGDNIFIYPNPASDNLIVEVSENGINSIFEVYDVQGKQIIQKILRKEKTSIDITDLASGIYYVEVKTGDGIAVKKFVKE